MLKSLRQAHDTWTLSCSEQGKALSCSELDKVHSIESVICQSDDNVSSEQAKIVSNSRMMQAAEKRYDLDLTLWNIHDLQYQETGQFISVIGVQEIFGQLYLQVK